MDFNINIKVGDIIKNPETDSQRLGHYIILGNTREEVNQYCKNVMDILKIEVV